MFKVLCQFREKGIVETQTINNDPKPHGKTFLKSYVSQIIHLDLQVVSTDAINSGSSHDALKQQSLLQLFSRQSNTIKDRQNSSCSRDQPSMNHSPNNVRYIHLIIILFTIYSTPLYIIMIS